LQPEEPGISALALRLLTELAPRYQQLFILGDFVEYWLGDDAYDGSLDTVFDALQALPASGVKTHLMLGNRDFLFGEDFAKKLGLSLIRQDTYSLEDEGINALLLHGDTLCTDDIPYQQLRTMLRNEQWQASFLAKTVPERIAAAQALREASREQTAEKSSAIMDVNQQSVEQLMRSFNSNCIIHGHTHRANTHRFNLDGVARKRMVLGDWSSDGASLAHIKNTTLELFHWPR
jgi:UDP-2,3-diacylglucosamine hydrolase